MTNIWTYDVARWAFKRGVPWVPKIFGRLTRVLYACELPYTADIDRSVTFAHRGLGVVVGHDAVIGPGCKILPHVTIGGRSGVRANPVIGSDVLIGTGACVLGGVQVGDGAVVGAQAVVLKDVPSGYRATGVPAHVDPRKS